MTNKKGFVRILTIGSIFLFTSLSFFGIVSLQDHTFNDFWVVNEKESSFFLTAYAQDHELNSKSRLISSTMSTKKPALYAIVSVQTGTTTGLKSPVLSDAQKAAAKKAAQKAYVKKLSAKRAAAKKAAAEVAAKKAAVEAAAKKAAAEAAAKKAAVEAAAQQAAAEAAAQQAAAKKANTRTRAS